MIFNSTSVNNCSWDISTAVHSLTLASGYTGTVTQGNVDINIGAGGYLQQAGTFVPNSAYWVVDAGSFVVNGGGFGGGLRIELTGIGTSFKTSSNTHTLRVTGSTTFTGNWFNIYGGGGIEIPVGGEFILPYGRVIYDYYPHRSNI